MAPDLAILAAAQCQQVLAYRRPRVAILSTGNELVSIDQPLQPGQIVDSNQMALAALVVQSGGEPVYLGIIPDQPEALRAAIANALTTADLILSTGGVSVGDYDFVEEILTALGATLEIQSVAIKPGKPLTVATFPTQGSESRSVLYFGLPGNPASVLVTFWRFVQPALQKLAGLRTGWEPRFIQAKLQQSLRSDGKRETYVWGRLELVDGLPCFTPAAGVQNSGNLINLAQTNGLAVISIGQTELAAGQLARVLLVGDF
jgi:molybdopterin molybdotransferase